MKMPASLRITVVSLIVTNLFLLVAALVLEWSTYDQLMVFWC